MRKISLLLAAILLLSGCFPDVKTTISEPNFPRHSEVAEPISDPLLSYSKPIETVSPNNYNFNPTPAPATNREQPVMEPDSSSTAITEPAITAPPDKPIRTAVYYSNKVAVLTYHNIDTKESMFTISPARLDQQLQALNSHHFNVITIEQFIGFLNHRFAVPNNAVVITFDDGYESFYNYAYPELKKLHMAATDFLIVSYVDTTSKYISFLKWQEITEMKQKGFSFYSHTYDSHHLAFNGTMKYVPDLSNPVWLPKQNRLETQTEYKSRIKTDLTLAEQILKQRLNNNLSALCFPFGSYNKTVMKVAQEVGIQYFFTGKEGINSASTREVFRIDAGFPFVSANKLISKLSRYKTIS